MEIKDCIKGQVKFEYYRDNQLWYICENGFQFPVPIEDIGNATFLAEDRAMLFMRYIRKHIEKIDISEKIQSVETCKGKCTDAAIAEAKKLPESVRVMASKLFRN